MIEKITEKYPDFDDLKYTVNELIDIVNKHDQKLKLLLDGLEKWAQSQQDKETTIVFEQKE